MTEPDPTNPADTALGEVLGHLEAEGDGGQFRAVDSGEVQCLTCRTVFDASDLASEVTRLEGASDPADMVMVVPAKCPSCHTDGTLVLGYGPDASAEDSEVVRAMTSRSRP